MRKTSFDTYVCVGDYVEQIRTNPIRAMMGDSGITTFRARIEPDLFTKIDDDDCHSTDKSNPMWEGVSDETYEAAMEARAAWFRDEWRYVTIVVSAERDGWSKDCLASCSGVEANYPGGDGNVYLTDLAHELIAEAAMEVSEATN